MRRHHIPTAAILIVLATVITGCANSYQNGWTAYENGAHDVAYNEWWPLAEQGNPRAQYLLGVLYQDGRGVSQDSVAAVHWFHQSAEQGFAPAQNNLGLMYYNGEGVQRDHSLAAMWYERAAVQGFAHAQNNLAVMHMLGQAPNSDSNEAARLFQIAAANGNVKSQQIMQHWLTTDDSAPPSATASATSSSTQP